MKRLGLMVMTAAMLVSMTAARVVAAADAAEASAEITQVRLASKVDEIARAYADLGWFNGVVVLAKSGAPVFERAYGMANREAGVPNSLHTRFNLGSIMKHFTAVLVLQQVEEGTLSLDDTLAQFDLGFTDPRTAGITISQLLHHRSGFPDIFTAAYRENQLAFDTIEKRLELLRTAPLMFDPGSDTRYSNYGYTVLGAVLQKVTGERFEVLLHDKIFKPLSLTNSVYPYAVGHPDQSLRYSFNYAGEQAFVGVTEHHGPDGGIEATADDVLTFFRALFYSDRLLSRKGDAFKSYFGGARDHWASFGGGTGLSTAVELDFESDYQIVVLANTDNLVAELISGRVLSVIREGSHAPITLPPHVYAYQQYQALGPQAFSERFRDIYNEAGYGQFIGRTLNELGMSLLADKEWDQALGVFRALEATFPSAPQVYDSLAFAYSRMGQQGEAQAQFRKALALKGDFRSDYSADSYGTEQ